MTPWSWLCLSSVLTLVMVTTADAAGPEDWPCVHRKVPEISLAAVWTGPPLDDQARGWRTDPEIVGLVELLAARRTSQEQALEAIASLAGNSGQAKLLALLAGLVETINAERADVIAGIERFGRRQKQLADALRDETTKVDAMRADATTDPAALAERSEQLNWQLRIFDQQLKSLRFVCEATVQIEQRLFALARAIQNNVR